MGKTSWAKRAKLKLKLSSPVGITLTNSEAKILLDGQQKAVELLEKDEERVEKIQRGINVDIDDSIAEASEALNMARGTYRRTKNPILQREWARRMVVADRTVQTLVQTKKRTELVASRLKMIAGDIRLELMAAEARVAETKMYVDAGDSLRLVGDKLIQARAKSKPMKVEYKNLEITMEGAESLVSDMGDDEVITEAERLL